MRKTGEGTSPKFGRKIGFEALFTIQRSDFGIDYAAGAVGDEVSVTVSIEANHSGGHEHKED
jgi:polyisoprenoid-binding protein YceI